MDKVFIDGMMVRKAPDGAPDFILCKGVFKVAEMVAFLNANATDGWVNFEIKEARSGKLYAELDTWKPTKQDEPPQSNDEDIPF